MWVCVNLDVWYSYVKNSGPVALYLLQCNRASSLKTGPARPGHAKIAIYTTAVEFDQFSLYSTGTMARYDRLSL